MADSDWDALDNRSDPSPFTPEEMTRQIRDLQQRVRSLEGRIAGSMTESSPAPELSPLSPPAPGSPRPTLDAATALPVFGKGLLGIAGAYLLRALTESGAFPLTAGAAAGILYALFWLVLAARAGAGRRLAAAVYGVTSVLILVPLLWETIVRFQAISSPVAAGVLVLFSGFGLAISWRQDLSAIAWITTLAGIITASGLIVAIHDLAPFTLALLAMAAMVEFSACLDHWLRERWIVGLIADFAVFLMTYVTVREGGLPEGYVFFSTAVVVTAQIALLVIYLSSTIVRTLFRRLTFTAFETIQCAAVLLLALRGVLGVAHGNPTVTGAVSFCTLAGGAACYTISFAFLSRGGQKNRNFYTYSTFGLLLVFAGGRILTSDAVLVLFWSILALVCLWIGTQAERITLKWHGALYLLVVATVSGYAAWATRQLLGMGSEWVRPELGTWIAAASSIIGYGLILRGPRPGNLSRTERFLLLVLAANCAWIVAGLGAGALIAISSALAGSAQTMAFSPTFRTAVLTILAVAMAWGGRRWRRFELVWLVYPVMATAAAKLLLRDLRQGNALPLFTSLLLYGGSLVLLPRLMQAANRTSSMDGTGES